MGLFSKPEVIILKESSDAKQYLSRLEELRKDVTDSTKLAKELDKEISMVKAGIAGEDAIMFELKNAGMDLVILHDILLESPSGNTAQIDYYVVTPYIILIIECKNLYGNIEINNKGDFIRTISYGGKSYKEGIYSPITQNARHTQVIKECKMENAGFIARASMNHFFDDFYKSLVVLANPKTIVNDKYAPKDIRSQVVRADQLISKIKELNSAASKNLKSTLKEMLEHGRIMLQRNREERKDYFERFDKWKKELDSVGTDTTDTTEAKEEPLNEERVCPRCGKTLVLRTASKGEHAGNQFWGCSSYPKCRYHEYI